MRGGKEGKGMVVEKVLASKGSGRGKGLACTVHPKACSHHGASRRVVFMPSPMAHGTVVHKKGVGMPVMLRASSLTPPSIIRMDGGTCAVARNGENNARYSRVC